MKKVLSFVKGRGRDDKKDPSLSLNVANISVEITDPTGVTTPSDDFDYIAASQHCTFYEVDLSGKDKSITKLHKAAWVGNIDKAKNLLKKIDINVTDSSGRTPLHLAVAQSHTNMVWFLLSNKALPNIPDSGGKSAFLKAVQGGFNEIVSNILDKGADINFTDYEGNTALHLATKLGYYDITTNLLKKGANFECANKKGEFPLHIAATAEHMDIVELLLRYGANINVTDGGDRTPLMLAARCGSTRLVELFLEYGAKKDMTDSSNFTAQDYAIRKGYGNLATLLVTEIGTINEEDEDEDEDDDSEKSDSGTTDSPAQVGNQPTDGSSGSLAADVSEGHVEDSKEDSWNDSQVSESDSKTKIPSSKFKEVFPSASDDDDDQDDDEEDDASEEQSPMKVNNDSPHSCVIPPLLEPPRSWDLIQAGMIDYNNGSEVTRCSITALGTLRSRQECFNESNKSDVDLPITSKALLDVLPSSEKDHLPSDDKIEEGIKAPEAGASKNDKSDLSTVESDWESDESIPLDKEHPIPTEEADNSPLKTNQRVSVDVHHEEIGDFPPPPEPLVPEDTALLQVTNQSDLGSGGVSPEPVSEKRARMLLMQQQQSLELTLTDDRTEEKSDHSEGSPIPLPCDVDVAFTKPNPEHEALMGYEEMWAANAAYDQSISPVSFQEGEPASNSNLGLSIIDENKESSEGEQSPGSQIIIDLDHSTVTKIPADSTNKPFSEEERDAADQMRTPGTKTHARNKSVFVLPLVEKPSHQVHVFSRPAPLPPLTLQHLQDQCINQQLACYDEAIRDLATSAYSKNIRSSTQTMDPVQPLQSSSNILKMPDLLSGARETPENPRLRSNVENEEEEDDELNNGEIPNEGDLSSNEIGKKRQTLFAMQKFDPPTSQSQSQGRSNINLDLSSSDSEDEHVYWGAAGAGKVPRQPTVIKKTEAGVEALNVVEPSSCLSPGSISLSEDAQPLSQVSSETSNEDVTAPMENVESQNKSTGVTKLTKHPTLDSKKSGEQSHDTLLKHRLQVVTEERGRLAETTVELGERTERLLYELADAREAARARDEVIALLQIQLDRLEESHCKGLEEAQTHRYHLDSRDQELRHLAEVCRKAEDEKEHLKELVRLKDNEIGNLLHSKAKEEQEAKQELISREHDKEATINELKIHLKYVEQERDKLRENVLILQQEQATLKAQGDALLEERSRLLAQNASNICPSEIEAKISHEFNDEKEKGADPLLWQEKIKEEVSNAVQLLKSEYERVELILRKHNKTLETMVEKLQLDVQACLKREQSLETQLLHAKEELEHASKEVAEARNLQLTLSEMKTQIVSHAHRIETLTSELKAKELEVNKAQNMLEIVRKEKAHMETLLKQLQHEGEFIKLSKAMKDSVEADDYIGETKHTLDKLEVEHLHLMEANGKEEKGSIQIENDQLKRQNDELNSTINSLSVQLASLENDYKNATKKLNAAEDTIKKLESNNVSAAQKNTDFERKLQLENEELEKQITEMKLLLRRRDSSPGSASLSNASAMTDNLRWSQSGLMGVVQKQKEEIENLKSECAKLRSGVGINESTPRQSRSRKEGNLEPRIPLCVEHEQKLAALKTEINVLRGEAPGQSLSRHIKELQELRNKVKEEISLRCSLEVQMNKLRNEVQEKVQMEKELQRLKIRLDKDYVSRQELSHLRTSDTTLYSELSTRLAQVNKLLLQQAHDRSTGQGKENTESQIRKQYEETKEYLTTELAKVRASFQAKDDEEKNLKQKYENLIKKQDEKEDQRRKRLIEKAYQVGPNPTKREVKNDDVKSPLLNVGVNPGQTNLQKDLQSTVSSKKGYSDVLYKQVKRCGEKYKISSDISNKNSEDQMKILQSKYCLP